MYRAKSRIRSSLPVRCLGQRGFHFWQLMPQPNRAMHREYGLPKSADPSKPALDPTASAMNADSMRAMVTSATLAFARVSHQLACESASSTGDCRR